MRGSSNDIRSGAFVSVLFENPNMIWKRSTIIYDKVVTVLSVVCFCIILAFVPTYTVACFLLLLLFIIPFLLCSQKGRGYGRVL